MRRTEHGIWVPGDEETAEEEAVAGLCPVCDLLHGHEVMLVVQEGETPEVYCPCPACQQNGLRWDTREEYQEVWLPANIDAIEAAASEARRAVAEDEAPTEEDREWESKVDEMVEEQAWKIDRQKSEGKWDPKKRDPWEGHGPPD